MKPLVPWLQAAGALQLAVASVNLVLPRKLEYDRYLLRLSPVLRQVFIVHAAYIAGVLAGFGALSLLFAEELAGGSPLGRFLSGLLAAFWAPRVFVQLLYYDPDLKRRHPLANLAFLAAFSYLAAVFSIAALGGGPAHDGHAQRSAQVPVDVHGSMEDTQDVDVAVRLEEVHDPVVAVEKDPDVPFRHDMVPVPKLGVPFQELHLFVDSDDRAPGRSGIVTRDVVVDVPKPHRGLVAPPYLRHESIRLFISSFETTRPASESASPRSTIRANASSRRISSYELSAGCSRMTRIIRSLIVPVSISIAPRSGSDCPFQERLPSRTAAAAT